VCWGGCARCVWVSGWVCVYLYVEHYNDYANNHACVCVQKRVGARLASSIPHRRHLPLLYLWHILCGQHHYLRTHWSHNPTVWAHNGTCSDITGCIPCKREFCGFYGHAVPELQSTGVASTEYRLGDGLSCRHTTGDSWLLGFLCCIFVVLKGMWVPSQLFPTQPFDVTCSLASLLLRRFH